MGRTRSSTVISHSQAVLHDNLMLVQGPAAELDELLKRAPLQRAMVYRLGPRDVLLTRDALALFLDPKLKQPVVFEEPYGTPDP